MRGAYKHRFLYVYMCVLFFYSLIAAYYHKLNVILYSKVTNK